LVIQTGDAAGWDAVKDVAAAHHLEAPRLEVKIGALDQPELARILAGFDVGVFPSRVETFGMAGLECMAVGRTVICTRWGGMADYLRPDLNFGIDYTLVPDPVMQEARSLWGADFDPHWAQPSYEHLRVLMRHCYEHRREVQEKGKAAAKWVREHWTWERAARQLIDAIDGLEA
jgi:glycosyltransferase involved in cell wall biosynthesis